MNLLKSLCLFLLIACCARAGDQTKAWTYVPEAKERQESPRRIVLLSGSEIESQTLLWGVRSAQTYPAKIDEESVEFTNSRGVVLKLRKRDGSLVLQDDKEKKELVFRPSGEWDRKFDEAPPVPKTKAEAIATLRKIMEPESLDQIRSMKKDELIGLHFGFGTGIRNAFGLWSRDSALLKDLGGGHPDDACMRLIEAFWEDLQKDSQLNKPLHGTPAKSPSSSTEPEGRRP